MFFRITSAQHSTQGNACRLASFPDPDTFYGQDVPECPLTPPPLPPSHPKKKIKKKIHNSMSQGPHVLSFNMMGAILGRTLIPLEHVSPFQCSSCR